jgi:hypothetical protein
MPVDPLLKPRDSRRAYWQHQGAAAERACKRSEENRKTMGDSTDAPACAETERVCKRLPGQPRPGEMQNQRLEQSTAF